MDALFRRKDAGMRDPLHHGVEIAQMLLMPSRAAAGGRVGEIERQRAADQREAAGPRRLREGIGFALVAHRAHQTGTRPARQVTVRRTARWPRATLPRNRSTRVDWKAGAWDALPSK